MSGGFAPVKDRCYKMTPTVAQPQIVSRGKAARALRADPRGLDRARSRLDAPGFRAVAVHRFGNWRMRISNKFVRAPLSMFYRMMFRHVRNHYGIELPYSASVGRRVVIEHQGCIVVHGNSRIGDDSIIRQGVTLGNKTLTRPMDAPTLGVRVNVGAGAKSWARSRSEMAPISARMRWCWKTFRRVRSRLEFPRKSRSYPLSLWERVRVRGCPSSEWVRQTRTLQR